MLYWFGALPGVHSVARRFHLAPAAADHPHRRIEHRKPSLDKGIKETAKAITDNPGHEPFMMSAAELRREEALFAELVEDIHLYFERRLTDEEFDEIAEDFDRRCPALAESFHDLAVETVRAWRAESTDSTQCAVGTARLGISAAGGCLSGMRFIFVTLPGAVFRTPVVVVRTAISAGSSIVRLAGGGIKLVGAALRAPVALGSAIRSSGQALRQYRTLPPVFQMHVTASTYPA